MRKAVFWVSATGGGTPDREVQASRPLHEIERKPPPCATDIRKKEARLARVGNPEPVSGDCRPVCQGGAGAHVQLPRKLHGASLFRKIFYSLHRARYFPVCDAGQPGSSPGGPVNRILPPRPPPSGPISITQSAAAISSRRCFTTTTVFPRSTSRRSSASRRATSRLCRPVVGSSRT